MERTARLQFNTMGILQLDSQSFRLHLCGFDSDHLRSMGAHESDAGLVLDGVFGRHCRTCPSTPVRNQIESHKPEPLTEIKLDYGQSASLEHDGQPEGL
jgi:NAD(P)H-hydrate repair Nnr-like enzyme with NAD(P)H-hydrate epimerase domain